MHRDIVSEPPPGATIIGSNANCECQAMIIPDRVLSVQGIFWLEIFRLIGDRSPGIQPSRHRIPS